MFKFLGWVLLSVMLHASTTYVVADMSMGMSKKEFKELRSLTYPKTGDNIFKNGERVKLLAFNTNGTVKNSFIFYEKNTKEKAYKKAKTSHKRFFKKIYKYIKRPKKRSVNANVVFLVDTSGSMVSKKNGNLLRQVKRSMKYFIKNKSKKSRVSIITFDGKKKQKEGQRSKILIENERSKKVLLKTVDSIKVSKYDTFLGSGLKKVQEVLPVESKLKNLVMIFTDGKEINDFKVAKNALEALKNNDVEVKVLAVGGADVEMLKTFSTSHYVYNATSADLQSISKDISTHNDEIIVKLNNYFRDRAVTKDDRIILYTTFVNIDSVSDFSLVPNLSSNDFYDELKEQNKKRNVQLELHGASVYGRVLNAGKSESVNNLRGFWEPFFKDANATLRYFNSDPLTKEEF